MLKQFFPLLLGAVGMFYLILFPLQENSALSQPEESIKDAGRKTHKKILLDLEMFEAGVEIRDEVNKLYRTYQDLVWAQEVIQREGGSYGQEMRYLKGVITGSRIRPDDDIKEALGSYDPKAILTALSKNQVTINNVVKRLEIKMQMLTKDYEYSFAGLEKKLDVSEESKSPGRQKLESEMKNTQALIDHIRENMQ